MENNIQAYSSIGEVIAQFKTQASEIPPFIIQTGFKTLDAYINGFSSGELCVVGARPAMGKSLFTINLMARMVRKGIPVAFFSVDEGLNVNFLSRIVASIRNVGVPMFFDEKVTFIQNATFDKVPLYMNPEPRMRLQSLLESARRLKAEKDIKCLFIDSIQTLIDSEQNGKSEERADRICKEIKSLAVELDIPIIVTSEINKSSEFRVNHCMRPMLCDLRSCRALESYADKVLLLHRHEYYGIYVDEKGRNVRNGITVIVAKNKYGVTGELQLGFAPFGNFVWIRDQVPFESEPF